MAKGGLLGYLARNRHFDFRADHLPSSETGRHASEIDQANAALKTESARAPFKTIAWYTAVDAKKKLKATGSSIGKKIKTFTAKPHGWKTSPIDSFYKSQAAAALANAVLDRPTSLKTQ